MSLIFSMCTTCRVKTRIKRPVGALTWSVKKCYGRQNRKLEVSRHGSGGAQGSGNVPKGQSNQRSNTLAPEMLYDSTRGSSRTWVWAMAAQEKCCSAKPLITATHSLAHPSEAVTPTPPTDKTMFRLHCSRQKNEVEPGIS